MTYQYDAANRLIEAGGVSYTWDNNGNLLSDGTSTYTYNHANRLAGVAQDGVAYSYAYNGMGDRLQQSVDGVTTNYTLDLNTGLTQVLADGTHTYLYGRGRIAQVSAGTPEYFLGDALGSMRQVTDPADEAVLTRSYQPYGGVLSQHGGGATPYGFTCERMDGTGLVHLRARYLNTVVGRFLNKDPWSGNVYYPLSMNRWMYVEGNPVNTVDPSGLLPCNYCVYFTGELGKLCRIICCDKDVDYPEKMWTEGYILDRWEVSLLALTVQTETQNGTWDDWLKENLAWVFLNRLSLTPQHYPTMWSAVNGPKNRQSAVVCYHSRNMGDQSCNTKVVIIKTGIYYLFLVILRIQVYKGHGH